MSIIIAFSMGYSKLARTVAFIGEQAPAAGARAAMKCDLGAVGPDGLLGGPLTPQLLHAGADRFEIVGCSRL
jgi:hypothetical protein